ncbi:restriction endonuclease [Ruegeria arenilitoris]|uniref:restriction endonuclease n=1 Tax=Ruegeria arenilitoris TaxID=1173585 RepID=UPI00147AB7E0|nr:restriction endonuclease [Ruegeria arenilitoris]
MATFTQFVKSIREVGNDGKVFEVFCRWFLKNDPKWSTQVQKVWLWDDYPDKWGPDCGVDLVFQRKDGSHWAVQAKCYDANYYVTKADIDKFLSETNRAGIHGRLLMATTDMLGGNATRNCL